MKKTFKLLVLSPLLITVLYCGAWLYFALELKKGINQFYEIDGPKQGYEFYGEAPDISGFPFKPKITYEKGFAKDNLSIRFDTLSLTALPFPQQPLDIKIDTLAIQPAHGGQLYEVDKVTATLIIPKKLPKELTKEYVTPWQKEVGKIHIKSLEINKNSMLTHASGFIGLDQALQPTLDLDTTVTDYDKLIHFMSKETSELKPIPAAIALGVLNNIARTNETTGQKFVELDVQIKKRRLIMGPIKTIKIPKVIWP